METELDAPLKAANPELSRTPGLPRAGARVLSYLPFLALFAAGLAWKWSLYFSLSSKAEMWAEGGTNYFFHAHHSSLWEALKATDFGYLPLLPRLISLVVEALHVPVGQVAGVYQSVAMVGLALLIASPTLPFFRCVLPSDAMRVLLSLGLLFHFDYQLHTFINFSYYGIIPCFLILVSLSSLPRMSTAQSLALGSVLALFALSKPFYVAMAPPLAVAVLWAWRRGDRNALRVAAVGLAGTAIQLGFLLVNRATAGQHAVQSLSAAQKLWIAIVYWATSAAGQLGLARDIALRWAAAGMLLLAFAMVRRLQVKGGRSSRWLGFCALSVSGGAALLAVAAITSVYTLNPGELPRLDALANRHWFFTHTVLFLGLGLFFFRRFTGRRDQLLLAVGGLAWLASTGVFRLTPAPAGDPGGWISGYSDWSAFAPHIPSGRDEPYCVPLNPYPWLLGHKCGYLLPAPPVEQFDAPTVEAPGARLPVSANLLEKRLQWVGLAAKEPSAGANEQKVIAYGDSGQPLAIAPLVPGHGRMGLAFFRFEPPVSGVKTLELVGYQKVVAGAELPAVYLGPL
jgi:hypothetical protein